MDEFDRGLNEASNKFKSFSDNLSKVGSNMKDLLSPAVEGFKAVEGVGQKTADVVKKGLTGFAAAATAVGGFGASAMKAGSEFDTAMSQVAATSNYSVQELADKTSNASIEFEKMRNKAIEMGSTTSFSAKEAAEGLNILRMSGLSAEDSITGISTVLDLAAAGAISMADSATYTTGAVKGFSDSMGNAQYYADLIAKGATLANTNVGQLGEALSGVSATAATYSQKADGVTLSLLRLAEQQVVGTEATTALRRVYADLYTPTDKAKAALESLGVATYDENGKARDLNLVVDELSAAMSGMSDQQKNATASTIFTTWGLQAFNKMTVSSTEKVQEFKEGLANAFGSAALQASTQLDNLSGDIIKFNSALEGLQIVINDALTPTLREFAQFGQKAMAELLSGFQGGGVSGFMSALTGVVTEGVTMLAEKAPLFAEVSVEFVSAIGEGLIDAAPQIFDSANEVISTITSGLSNFIGEHGEDMVEIGEEIIMTVMRGFENIEESILPFVEDFASTIILGFSVYHEDLFEAGLEILAAIGRGIVEDKEYIQEIISETIYNLVMALKENADDIIEGGIALLEALVGAIEENWPLIKETGMEIIGKLIEGISTSSPGVQAIITTAILPHILKIIETATNVGKTVKSVVDLVSGGLNNIMGIGSKLMSGIQALWGLIAANPVVAAIAAVVAALVLLYAKCEGFRDFVNGLIEGIGNAIQSFGEFMIGFWGGIIDGIIDTFSGIPEKWGEIKESLSETWEGIKEAASEKFNAIKDKIVEVWENIKTSAAEKWEEIKGSLSEKWENIKETASEKFTIIHDKISETWDKVKTAASAKWEEIKGTLSEKWEGIKNTAGTKFNEMKDKILDVFGNLKTGISGKIDEIKGAIQEKWSGIVSSAKGWGSDLCENLASGISGAIRTVKNAASSVAKGVKSILGFSEPEEGPLSDFHTYAPDMMQLFAKGIIDNTRLIKDAFSRSLDLSTPALDFSTNYFGTTTANASGIKTAPYISGNPSAAPQPIHIVVQSVLDSRIIGETSYTYMMNKERV